MNTLAKVSGRGIVAALVVLGLVMGLHLAAQSATTTRPIEEFVAAQGTFCWPDGMGGCILFLPPDPNFQGWGTNFAKTPVYYAGVDYAGLANAYPSGNTPKFSGNVTERPLQDGRAEVTVLLHTKGANIWVIQFDLSNPDLQGQIGSNQTLFGNYPKDVADGAPQALADSNLHLVFTIRAPGAPLPDLEQLLWFPEPEQEIKFIKFNAQAKGPLTAAYGVDEGTPGKCTVVQTGLLEVQLKQLSDEFKGKAGTNSRVAYDGFPAENIDLQVIGK
jgi:hypothetical protein